MGLSLQKHLLTLLKYGDFLEEASNAGQIEEILSDLKV
jgi:hypothetical protein